MVSITRPSVERAWKTLGITRPSEQRRLGKQISAFWKSRLAPTLTRKISHSDIAQIAQAFIDQIGIAYLPGSRPKEPREILESVTGLMKAQRRCYIDNSRRGASTRYRRGTRNEASCIQEDQDGVTPLTSRDRKIGTQDSDSDSDSEYREVLDGNERNSRSEGTTKMITRSSGHGREATPPQPTYPYGSQAAFVEISDDSDIDEQAGARSTRDTLHFDESGPEATILTVIEDDVKSPPSQEPHLEAWSCRWTFSAIPDMAKALDACLKKLLDGEKEYLKRAAQEDGGGEAQRNKMIVLEDYYDDFLHAIIFKEIRSSADAKSYTTVPAGDDAHGQSQKWVIDDGETWEFLSVMHKALALKAAMEELSRGIDGYLDRLKKETDNAAGVRLAKKHHYLRVETRIKGLLREHGAMQGRVPQDSRENKN